MWFCSFHCNYKVTWGGVFSAYRTKWTWVNTTWVILIPRQQNFNESFCYLLPSLGSYKRCEKVNAGDTLDLNDLWNSLLVLSCALCLSPCLNPGKKWFLLRLVLNTSGPEIHIPKNSGTFRWKLHPKLPPSFLSKPCYLSESLPNDDPSPRGAQGHSHRVFKLPPENRCMVFQAFSPYPLYGARKSSKSVVSIKPGLF